jgi:hypothetical protein
LNWRLPVYDDGNWENGNYGIGFETGTGAEDLINSEVDPSAVSIYTRTKFIVAAETVDSLFLGVDYDDAYVAYLNGFEIFRSPEMPEGDPLWNTDPAAHESSNAPEAVYGPIHDVSAQGLPLIVDGENLLAIGIWRNSQRHGRRRQKQRVGQLPAGSEQRPGRRRQR